MNGTDSKPVHTVSVRELIEFVLRRGDLGGEGQFVGSDRALAGIRGHQRIQRSRPADYQTEIPVEHRIDAGEFILRIRGRIDGLLVNASDVLLEEIKTVQGRWDKTPDPLHWAQAKFYACIYAREHGLSKIAIQLTYLELDAQEVTEFRETLESGELSDFFASTAAIYLEWLREQHFWEQERNRSIRELPFPFPAYRPGQRELAVASYRVLANGGRLFLAAPTGLGKTISVLFPAIKALGEGKLEHVFYLTARTVGRGTAENALAGLRRCGLKLRSVTLTAMEKVCTRNGQPCDPLTCPMRLGYYDRIKPALREALGLQEMNRSALETVARNHQVCPFELSLDASIWADVVICDYNYVFDPQVYLRRFFLEESGDYGFLVDEAHNLVDRAREMFSAELDGQEILDVKRALKRSVPRCVRALTKLHTTLRQAANPAGSEVEAPDPSDPSDELNLFPASAPPTRVGSGNIRTSRDFPESLSAAVEAALIEAERWLVQNQPAPFRDPLLALYFRLRSFQRTAEAFDERYVTIVQNGPVAKVRLFCLDPSHLLRQALARGGAAVFFSATLAPIDYFCTVLGGMPEDPRMQLASPFPPENLAVLIHDRIQTQFKARAESLGDVVAAIRTVVAGRIGNYLVYFPSYQYLNAVLAAFQSGSGYPSVSVLAQRPGMTESERESFLAAFSMEHGETLVGFAVLGGIFGEGIDLAGERLIGAVIVGVGLPQMCIERDLIRDYFQQRNVAGFDYAYTYPGMNRVLQSIGRVIRSETDRGVVLLIDARFSELRYRRLFPAWWKFVRVRHSSGLEEAIAAFWNDRPIAESGNRQR